MEEQLARGPIDLPFLMLVTILTVVGAIMVFSASYPTAINEGKDPANYFFKQAGYGAGGLVAMYVISKINYQRFRWMSMGVLAASYVLLILVLPFGYGRATVGAQRWMSIAGISFQPSEIAKVGVILYFAARLSKRDSEKPKKFNPRSYWSVPLGLMQRTGFLELIPYGLILLVIVVLMSREPHMSGTLLILVGRRR